jgi:monoamine oxidase
MHNTLIIGAGVAGLSAAQALRAAGHAALVIEARDRVGGRIWTDRSQGPVEYGAEFIHGEHVVTWELVRTHHLATSPWQDGGRLFAIGGRVLPPSDQMYERVYALWEAVHTYNGPEESAALVLDSLAPRDDPARYFVQRWLAGIEAGDAARLSAQALSREWELNDYGDTNFHLDGGYDQISTILAEGLAIRLQCPVEQVAWNEAGVTLTLASGEQLQAKNLLITVPIGVLQAGTLRFDPPLPADKRAAISAIDMGHVTKLAIWFAHAFWEPFVVLSTDGPVASWWPVESASVPMLMGYTGGPAALVLARMGEQQALHAALESLCTIFGPQARQHYRGARLVDWSLDPWSRGAYTYSPVGMGDAREVLGAALPPLFFAGEATCLRGDLATVHGAIASGRRAAAELLRHASGCRNSH